MFVLDVQSELSFPAGGCQLERLVARAQGLGARGLALADRGTQAAADRFRELAGEAGMPAVVGARFSLVGEAGVGGAGDVSAAAVPDVSAETFSSLDAPGDVEVLVFPLCPAGERWIEHQLALGTSIRPSELPPAADVAVIVQTHGVVPHAPGAVRRLAFRIRGSLHLAMPGPHAPELAVLGRDLGIPTVFAPSVRIVDAGDAPIHRLLVSIRGDHEGAKAAPRSGRPASNLRCGRQHSLECALAGAGGEALPRAERLFARLWRFERSRRGGGSRRSIPDTHLCEVDGGGVPATPVPAALEGREARARADILAALRDRTPGHTRVPWKTVSAELDALEAAGLLRHVAALGALIRRQRLHAPVVVHCGSWASSWVAWATGWVDRAPSLALPAPIHESAEVLAEIHLEVPDEDAAGVRAELTTLGGVVPVGLRVLTSDTALDWLDTHIAGDPTVRRAFERLVETGRVRGATFGRRLSSAADLLDGRPLDACPEPEVREFHAGRRLRVRVTGSDVLSLLACSHAPSPDLDALRDVPVRELRQLLDGPLCYAGAANLARLVAERRPDSVEELARCVALAGRSTSTPSGAVRFAGVTASILFDADLLACLRALDFLSERSAAALTRVLITHDDDTFERSYRAFVKDAVEAGHDRRAARRFLLDLQIVSAHRTDGVVEMQRARVLAALAHWLHSDRAGFLGALFAQLDGHASQLESAARWAARHGMGTEASELLGARQISVRADGDHHPVGRPPSSGIASWAKVRDRMFERRVG